MSGTRMPWMPRGAVPEITAEELKRRLNAGESVFLLDVRQPWEYDQAKLPNSVLHPLNRLGSEIEDLQQQIPAGATVVVYCHHGMRSLTGAALLLAAGVANVCSLRGGIDAWSVLIDPTVPRY